MSLPLRVATSATIDEAGGTIYIDGEPFPFAVADDIQVGGLGYNEFTTLVLPVLVDGVVIIDGRRGRKVIDGALVAGLGDVGEYARQLVHEQLCEAFAWLEA